MIGPSSAASATGTAAEDMAVAEAAAAQGDYDSALAVWVKYGHAGNARAQAEIGNCFMRGWGVERNADLAHQWLSL
ncbi:MAG TPA: sel1 repeat family protein, partial [Hyphomicrobiaceae bacterium]|nr:sel1 repeat family protein [Hyphomicrobiaceae bacterium]